MCMTGLVAFLYSFDCLLQLNLVCFVHIPLQREDFAETLLLEPLKSTTFIPFCVTKSVAFRPANLYHLYIVKPVVSSLLFNVSNYFGTPIGV